ncbi:hypothetical protein E4U42_003525 [Claviceps africana]|uniref:Uncharacterized protein n=1 Tax=Claviceps africana TaxID=83212 RepID=A0A8K0J728_9HYPO|nr:hypothetical protein E4U42_003525 [Claviceps africana]
MGADSKKPPPLPAPTETDTTTPSEPGTDLSKPGDEKSSYSIPEDGSPVTIRTRGHRTNKSQTSLLIEYFEGGRNSSGQERKPSVRVRLTPSKKSRGDHIQVTETKSTRKAALTRRIPLNQAIASREIPLHDAEDANSTTSYASATEESNVSRNAVDIEIDHSHRRRRPASPLIPSAESYHPGNPSEISAIPSDSFLDGTVRGFAGDPRASLSPRGNSSVVAAASAGALGGAAMGESSSNKARSKDPMKTSEKSRDKSEKKRHSGKTTASSVSEYKEDARSQRSRQSRSHLESNLSAANSSVVSSHLAPSHRSVDSRSIRSGASKSSSINNPKLLETVEDAIRRLILPELSALKREQSKRESRRGSFSSSATSISREDVSSDRRRSSGLRAEGAGDAARRRERRNREARHEYDDDASLHSPSHDSMAADYQTHERGVTPSKHTSNLAKIAAAGAAEAALAKEAAASLVKDGSEASEKISRDRRRRRTEHTRSRSLGRNMFDGGNLHDDDDDDDDDLGPAPPMPLMSDINPSELTRTSILSAESDRPHSASEELLGPALGTVREVSSPSGASTPTPIKSPFDHERHAMAMQHANVSHGDLKALPRGIGERVDEYDADEYGQKVPMTSYDEYDRSRGASDLAASPEDDFEDRYFSTQDVPPPLRYVPYQAGARGLSPIPSVSGYTEGGSEAPLPQNSSDTPSPSKTPEHSTRQPQHHHSSLQSEDSVARNVRDFDHLSADGANQSDGTAGGQAVRGIGANPKFVHPPIGVESAVASLVDGSMLDQSVVTGASGYDHNAARDSTLSTHNEQAKSQSSRGLNSLGQIHVDDANGIKEEDGAATPGSKSVAAQSQEHSEYDVDEYGRKVPRTKHQHPITASEAAITAGAVGAAAAALKAAKERRQAAAAAGQSGQDFQPAGVARNRSFKERTMHHGWEPQNTPTHSTDRLDLEEKPKFGTSGVPDVNEPMPEIGYVDDELQTNPSMLEERLDGEPIRQAWSGRATPTQHYVQGHGDHEGKTGGGGEAGEADGLGISDAVDAAAHNNETTGGEEDEWLRTSDERKRDTLITNPYEDTSPILNPQLNDSLLGARGLDAGFSTGSPGFGQKYDEGYMSNGPNRTPDVQQSKGKAVDFDSAAAGDEDPFYAARSHGRHLSGMSQGMTSPFYDAATGAGLDRIENKDIVALMQHLMVRDAQRSARDTEIVALLMNAALEMRNSFREMKELVQDTSDDVIFAGVENTEKLQKAINGPRPYPSGATSRSIQSPSHAGTVEENGMVKKKKLWKRALQGLSNKGTNDLSRIEDMLMQLLGEVDVLKSQTAHAMSTGGPGRSYENSQPGTPREHGKEHEADGSSPVTHANQPRAALSMRSRGTGGSIGGDGVDAERRVSERRVGAQPGAEDEDAYEDEDEDEDGHEDRDGDGRGDGDESEHEFRYDGASPRAQRAAGDHVQSPGQADKIQRVGSVPLATPPRPAAAVEPQPLSAENTPRTDKGKKNKSSSSMGWLPRISRWSGTTASSFGKAFRGSGASKKAPKNDEFRPPRRSGSSVSSFDGDEVYDPELYFGDDKMHRGASDFSLAAASRGESRMSFPGGLSPSQHMTPEDPKYKAHRNSLNLQHPQPRPGQTERFRTALESSAQEYNHNPTTPRSADWAGSATSLHRLPPNSNRFSHASSVHGPETDYYSSPGQQSAPPRPPKEPMDSARADSPPVSSRLSKLARDGGSPGPQQSSESGYGTLTGTYLSHYSGSSPKLENRNLNAALGVPARRPTGPRAMTPKSPEGTAREERRRRRDTFGTGVSDDTDAL